MSKTTKIDEFVDKLKHPLKAEIEEVINIIRSASNDLEEEIKWGGPSFDYKGPMATMNPRINNYVALIFHKGELIKDTTGLLEAAPKGKAYAKFYSMADVNKHRESLKNVVLEWIKIMNG